MPHERKPKQKRAPKEGTPKEAQSGPRLYVIWGVIRSSGPDSIAGT